MKRLRMYAVIGVVALSFSLLTGCGLYQGKTSAGRDFEFRAYGLGIQYFAVDFGSMQLYASGSPRLTLPLGVFVHNLLADRGFKASGVIVLGYYSFGRLRYVEPAIYGPYGRSAVKIGPMGFSARNVGDAPSLFPYFVDKDAVLEPDRYDGNHCIATAQPLAFLESAEGTFALESSLTLAPDMPDYFRLTLAEPCYITAITTSFDCGLNERALPQLLDINGNPVDTGRRSLHTLGVRMTDGEFLVKITYADEKATQHVLYELLVTAVSVANAE